MPKQTTRGFTALRGGVRQIAEAAAKAEQSGFHTAWSPEFYTRSAVVTLAHMATMTSTVQIGSSIAYGVGRSPLTVATEARSLDELSGGRLVLGLGTGTRRMMQNWHGVDPEGPASRMEELVPLLRRLWRLHEEPVKHDGRFYHVDLTPTAEIEAPVRTDIPVYTAGVNSRMVEVAGRVCDGFLGHPLFSADYLTEEVRPAIARGAAKGERDASRVAVCGLVICSVADDEEQARREVAGQLAFYAAPKAYGTVLERQGFGEAGAAIREAFAARDFDAMAKAVPDAMIDKLAVAGTPSQVADQLSRYDGILDHVIIYPVSFQLTPTRSDTLLTDLLTHAAPP
ncbi:LLM class flavin-dependent oxidoreductase [Pseudonocardia spinosispora]|uniref:LLM class flavin-dependent oxidoreductase n=1 Tax=Pseudonocardia spinosispora TaxID=103441 RepID=UPI00040D2767|nr:LLM class flavin-dependent oxidoreductase [Pseudonocardia spinosispora]